MTGRRPIRSVIVKRQRVAPLVEPVDAVVATRPTLRRATRRQLGLVLWDVLAPVTLAALGPLVEALADGRGLGTAIGRLDAAVLVFAILAPVPLAWVGAYARGSEHGPQAATVSWLTLAAATSLLASWGLVALVGASVAPARLLAVAALACLAWFAARWLLAGLAPRRPERMLILGSGRVAEEVARLARRQGPRGIQVLGCLDDNPEGTAVGGVPILGETGDLGRVLCERQVDRVVVSFSRCSDEEILGLVRECDARGVRVDVVPRFFDLTGPRPSMAPLGGLALIGVGRRRPSLTMCARKRAFDVIGSMALLVILAPTMALVAVAILVSDGRPVLFRQPRGGRGGGYFEIVKFRTMRSAAGRRVEEPESADVPVAQSSRLAKEDGARRSTALGRLLRTTSLDELPQLWNVFKGEMSLVGPRPLLLFEVRALNGWQLRRQAVRPGMTGLWQTVARSEASWEERMRLDEVYARHWSLSWDLRILLRTLPAVLRRRGAI